MTDVGSLAAEPLFGLPLAELWFALLFLILGMFLFLDGFDFGVGVLFATRDDDHEKEQLLAAIGPFWDGNEVWLVVFGVHSLRPSHPYTRTCLADTIC